MYALEGLLRGCCVPRSVSTLSVCVSVLDAIVDARGALSSILWEAPLTHVVPCNGLSPCFCHDVLSLTDSCLRHHSDEAGPQQRDG